MPLELTKALIHDFHCRIAEHRIEILEAEGTTKRLLQEEELALFRRYMSGNLSERERKLAAEAEADSTLPARTKRSKG